jgi:hypothetical protein
VWALSTPREPAKAAGFDMIGIGFHKAVSMLGAAGWPSEADHGHQHRAQADRQGEGGARYAMQV